MTQFVKQAKKEIIGCMKMRTDQQIFEDYLSEHVGKMQKEQREKELLFQRAMHGDYDLNTKYAEDLDLILKHLRNKIGN